MKITEKAYAKINLALEVREKRSDGYHEVTNLMIPIDLYDLLTFEKLDKGIILDSNFEIENNFVYQAAKLFIETYHITEGVKINLTKNIPMQAGLAGGSSDASACLRGLNKLFDMNISLDELANLSAKLGSDMPFCVYQKLAICTGRGEIVKTIDLAYEEIKCTLIKPNFGLSTKEIYSNYQYVKANRTKQIDNILIGLSSNNLKLITDNIFNDLQPISLNISSELKDLYYQLSKDNQVFMSGSGPTIFILHDTPMNLNSLNNNYQIIQTKIKKH